MTAKSKKEKKERTPKASKRGKDTLSATDIIVAVFFIGSILFCVLAFSSATHPMDDSFVLVPLVVGGAAGLLIGFTIYKLTYFESLSFLLVLMTICGALVAVGFVLTFNRPWDKSIPVSTFASVVNKYDQGSFRNPQYYIEVTGFSIRHLKVEEAVYKVSKPGDKVEVLTRRGYFGYSYLETVRLGGSQQPDTVPPAPLLPIEPLPVTPPGR